MSLLVLLADVVPLFGDLRICLHLGGMSLLVLLADVVPLFGDLRQQFLAHLLALCRLAIFQRLRGSLHFSVGRSPLVEIQFVFHCDLVLELLCLVHASRTLADLLLGHQHHIGLSLTLLHESLLHLLGHLPPLVSGLGDRPSRCLPPLFIHSTLVTVLLVTSLLELSHSPLLCNASNVNLLNRLLAHVLLVLLIVLRLLCFELFPGIILFGEHLGLF